MMEQILTDNEEGYQCDIESGNDGNESDQYVEAIRVRRKKKDRLADSISDDDDDDDGDSIPKPTRGRPRGTKRSCNTDTCNSELNDEPAPKKRKSLMIPTVGLLALACCSQHCFGVVPQDQINMLRDSLSHLSRIELSQWLLDWFWTHQRPDEKACYLIGEWRVCLYAFLAILGMPLSSFYAVRKRFKSGQRKIQGPGAIAGKMRNASQIALSWTMDFAYRFAEKMPEDGKLYLPSCLTKKYVYGIYKQETTDRGEQVTSESHFYWIWRKCLRHITIPAESRMSKCTKCTKIKEELSTTMDKKQRKEIMKKERFILQNKGYKKKYIESRMSSKLGKIQPWTADLERQKYYKHVTKARRDPGKYLSIILDGMDQSKTEIPHSVYRSTLTSSMWKLRTHLVGVIAHGRGIFGFFDLFQFPHGSNLTLHVLLRVLYTLRDSLPDVLYLQMDNCSRENKNKFILGFLCLLVELGVFIKIKLSFLVVGHTHEDIDQVFSRFSTWLKRHSAITLPKLLVGFANCYTPAPKSYETEGLFNISGWMEKHITHIQDHSRPHSFKIIKDETGKAVIWWKDLSADKEWEPTTGTDKYLLLSRPGGKPSTMSKSTEKVNVEQLKTDMRKYFSTFPSEPSDRKWWSEFLDSCESEETDESQINEALWLLPEIIEAKERSRQRSQDETTNPEASEILGNDKRKTNVVLGKPDKNRQDTSVTKVVRPSLKKGDLALVYLAKYAGEWPQMGRIVEVLKDEKCTLHWHKGSMTGSWSPCSIPVRGEKGKRVPWIEEIPISSVWFYGFSLTPAGKLNLKTKDQISNFSDF